MDASRCKIFKSRVGEDGFCGLSDYGKMQAAMELILVRRSHKDKRVNWSDQSFITKISLFYVLFK